MRFKINGRRYRLKENIKIKLDGFILIFLAYLCVRTGAGGAAFFMGLMGICFLFSQSKPRKRSILYCFAKTLVEYEDEKSVHKSA